MALSTPTLYTQAAFDATQSATFTFNVLGGSQVVKNQLFVVQGETIIYNGFNTTYSFTHVLPADTLEMVSSILHTLSHMMHRTIHRCRQIL